jgi:hypothetical protein
MTNEVLVAINGAACLINLAIYIWRGEDKRKINLFAAAFSFVVMLILIA